MRNTQGLLLLGFIAAACQGRIDDPGAGGGSTPGGAGAPGTVTTPHPPATTPADQMRIDQMMQAANPDLFAVAQKYFPATDIANAPKRMSRLTRTQLDLTTKALMPAFYGTTTA